MAHAQALAAAPSTGVEMKDQFRELLYRSGLPERYKASIDDTLEVFMGVPPDDEEYIKPKLWSFREFVNLVEQHLNWALPSLSIDRDGVVTAVWEHPGSSRWTLRFLKDSDIEWTYLLRSAGDGRLQRQTGVSRPSSLLIPPGFDPSTAL